MLYRVRFLEETHEYDYWIQGGFAKIAPSKL